MIYDYAFVVFGFLKLLYYDTLPLFNRPKNTVVQYIFCALFCSVQNEQGRVFVSLRSKLVFLGYMSLDQCPGGDDYVTQGRDRGN